MLVDETSVMTLEIVMLAQRGYGGGGGRNNRGRGYGSLRGRASSLSNQREKNNRECNNCYLANYNKKGCFFKYPNIVLQSWKDLYPEGNLYNQGL